MKKFILFLLFISSFQLNGQVRTGLRGGLNRSNLVERWDQPDGRITGAAVTRLNGGLLFEIPLEEEWFLHTGPYYSGKGAVSYTHLDVYKRQVYHWMGAKGKNFNRETQRRKGVKKEAANRAGQPECAGGARWRGRFGAAPFGEN